ncbi:MAG: HNH endonuclease family protein [Actinomycetota bacterium]|nr:HNH endonuclease family protein [Actinomycetota bacterium]
MEITRNDVLRRDLAELVVEPGTNGCVALTGTLPDPFTGEALPFVRGEDSGSQIHIDHLVSLSNAWQTGAQQLGEEQRTNFANDPLNLWAVQGSANQQKGDGDAATWLPPNRAARCDLVAHQIAVKAKYDLWVTPPEAEAMQRVLSACPGQSLPTEGQAATPATN